MSTQDLLEHVNLRFTNDKLPGIRRKAKGKEFQYFDLDGKQITDDNTIERINKLAIPPAYRNVWISPYKNGHLQAVGYDAKNRKQYRYHPLWIEISQQEKFSHLIDFAKFLPKIRRKIKKDLMLKGMPRQKIIASVVWLLENTLIRIGNKEYEKDNKSYGLTTLKNHHVGILGTNKIIFQFKGKSGVSHKVKFNNKKIANIVRRLKDLPGQDLFEYMDDDGKVQSLTSSDVNEYLKEITNSNITAKDFRTWGGTVLAASALDKIGLDDDEKISKKNIVETIKKVAKHLRNKPNTCKKYYIHPVILNSYNDGFIISNLKDLVKQEHIRRVPGLDDCENKVLAMLRHMLSKA